MAKMPRVFPRSIYVEFKQWMHDTHAMQINQTATRVPAFMREDDIHYGPGQAFIRQPHQAGQPRLYTLQEAWDLYEGRVRKDIPI